MPEKYSVKQLKAAIEFIRQNPQGNIYTPNRDRLTAREFRAWFVSCLDRKISAKDARQVSHETAYRSLCKRLGEFYSVHPIADDAEILGQYEKLTADMRHDARIVADYKIRRVRHSGSRNIFRTAYYRRKYPEINSQPFEF